MVAAAPHGLRYAARQRRPEQPRPQSPPGCGLALVSLGKNALARGRSVRHVASASRRPWASRSAAPAPPAESPRSEEHTSELQSRENLVCRLLLEKKNN